MGRFGKWLGKFNLTVGGEELELKPTLRHKETLMAIQQKSAKIKNLTTEQVKKLQSEQNDVFKDILMISYPEEMTVEEAEAFLLHNDLDFMQELYIAWGWLKRSDLESMKEELTKKVKKSLD